jgi:hypothetical protein
MLPGSRSSGPPRTSARQSSDKARGAGKAQRAKVANVANAKFSRKKALNPFYSSPRAMRRKLENRMKPAAAAKRAGGSNNASGRGRWVRQGERRVYVGLDGQNYGGREAHTRKELDDAVRAEAANRRKELRAAGSRPAASPSSTGVKDTLGDWGVPPEVRLLWLQLADDCCT